MTTLAEHRERVEAEARKERDARYLRLVNRLLWLALALNAVDVAVRGLSWVAGRF